MSLTQDVRSVSFSHGIVTLRPNRSAVPFIFETPRRLFCSESLNSHSRRIFHPCIDGIFQYGFESSIALTNFLNAALDFKGEKEIENVEHIRKNMPPADPSSPFGYHFTVDVRCRTKEGHHFLVEMQNDFRDDYHMKALIEHSRMLSMLDTDQTIEDKGKRAEKAKSDATRFWKGIQGIYTIVITNKVFDSEKRKLSYPSEKKMEPLLVNPYELRHTEQLERRYGDIPTRIVLLMLNHMNKPASELKTPIEDWAYVFKDQDLRSGVQKIPETKELDDIELIANRNPGIKEFIDRIDVQNLPFEVRDRHMRTIHYYNTTILDIEEKAEEKGNIKGHKTGKQEGLIEAARAIKKIGNMTDAEIASAFGLTESEVSIL